MDEEANAKNNAFTNRNTTFMTYNVLHLEKYARVLEAIPHMVIYAKHGMMVHGGILRILSIDNLDQIVRIVEEQDLS